MSAELPISNLLEAEDLDAKRTISARLSVGLPANSSEDSQGASLRQASPATM